MGSWGSDRSPGRVPSSALVSPGQAQAATNDGLTMDSEVPVLVAEAELAATGEYLKPPREPGLHLTGYTLLGKQGRDCHAQERMRNLP